jgi:hypothetical protein
MASHAHGARGADDADARDPELTISFLRADTPDPACTALADELYAKFTAPHPRRPEVGAYQDGASILVLPDTFDEYWNGAAGYGTRRKVRKAEKSGYTFAPIDRDQYLDDIFAINTSMPERQGREMKEAYRARPEPFGPLPDYGCPRHQIRTYGVLKDEHLVAYTWLYQVGEMCLFSTILGHGDHLANGVMYLLVAETLKDVMDAAGTRYAMYNMHQSGTEGLRFFKEQMGFASHWVNWQLGADDPPFTGTPPEVVAQLRAAAPRPSPRPASRWSVGRIVRGVTRRVRRLVGSKGS